MSFPSYVHPEVKITGHETVSDVMNAIMNGQMSKVAYKVTLAMGDTAKKAVLKSFRSRRAGAETLPAADPITRALAKSSNRSYRFGGKLRDCVYVTLFTDSGKFAALIQARPNSWYAWDSYQTDHEQFIGRKVLGKLRKVWSKKKMETMSQRAVNVPSRPIWPPIAEDPDFAVAVHQKAQSRIIGLIKSAQLKAKK